MSRLRVTLLAVVLGLGTGSWGCTSPDEPVGPAAIVEATRARGREAFYIASRGNVASRQLAERVGLSATPVWKRIKAPISTSDTPSP